MKPVRRIGATIGVVALMMAAALPVMAQSDERPDPEERSRPRIERFCANVPAHVARIERRLEIIGGDAETRGSLAWLQVKLDEAESSGRENLATMIGHRIAIKTELIDVLELRLDALADAGEICQERPTANLRTRRFF